MARTTITLTTIQGGYDMSVDSRYGMRSIHSIIGDAAYAAMILRQEISRYIDTNPEGGDYFAPPEVLEAMESNAVNASPSKGERISYYASPAALRAIQSEREASGGSQSGAINTLVMRGATL